MIATPNIQNLDSPKLLDLAIDEIRSSLDAQFSWLNCYGKAQKVTSSDNQKTTKGSQSSTAVRDRTEPMVVLLTNNTEEYLSMLPDTHLNNHSYFEVTRAHKYTEFGDNLRINTIVSIVFWYDLRKVYPDDWKTRTNENVKHDVLTYLRQTGFTKSNIKLIQSYDSADEIYRGYSHNEVGRQFLKRPFGGFKIDYELRAMSPC